VVHLGLGGPEAMLKRGLYDDVIILRPRRDMRVTQGYIPETNAKLT